MENNSRLKLVIPTLEYKKEVLKVLEEFRNNGEDIIHGCGGLDKLSTYEEWIEKVNNDLSKEVAEKNGRVQATQYIAIRKEDNKIVGFIQLRHSLNENLYRHGGHIGDSIRPLERNKGYSTEMIGMVLEEAKKLGIGNVLMTCDKENVASARTIIKNGGVLENEIEEEGIIIQRYWITLKKRFADGRNKANSIWKKEYKNLKVDEIDFKGNVSLLKIKKVKSPWYVDEEKRCILNENFKWLEMYPDGENYALTVIYDEKDNISEWYYDIARGVGEEEGIPYEDDLYLDVVVVPDGRIHLLDEDELEEAYQKREVSQKDYEMAYNVANKLIDTYKTKENIEKLKVFSDKYLDLLQSN